jgi:hypothetical protein
MPTENVQWIVTIEGSLYAAATSACSIDAVSADSDWPVDVMILPGALSEEDLARLSWSESIQPVRGTSTFGSISLFLNDVVPNEGYASGKSVWSYLFSKRPRNIRRAALAASITSASLSITVTSDPGFATGPQIIWIDREAIYCSSFNAGTKTFTVVTRGYLGTRATEHVLDAARSYAAFVWNEFPNPQKRRAILWLVRGTVATPVWRGYVGNAPRLSSENKTRWELQLEPAWTVQQNRPLGPSRASVRVVGFQPDSFRMAFARAGGTFAPLIALREPYTGAIPEELDTCVRIVSDKLNQMLAQITVSDPTFSATVFPSVSDGRPRLSSVSNGAHTIFFAHADLRGGASPAPPLDPDSPDFNARETSAGVWTGLRQLSYAPRAHVILRNAAVGLATSTIPVDATDGIPTSSLVTSYTDGADVTRVQWILAGQDQQQRPFITTILSVDTANRRIVGSTRFGLPGRTSVLVGARGDILLTEPTTLTLSTLVSSSHWARAIQRGVLAPEYGLDGQADARDWNWDRIDEVISATNGEAATTSRTWVFDGSTKLGEFVSEMCALDGCAVATRDSRLVLIALGAPLPTDPVALEIDLTEEGGGNYIAGRPPGWGMLNESITNVVRVERDGEDGPTVTVNNQQSVALYGASGPFVVKVKGALAQSLSGMTPFELARGPLSRLLGLWGEPSDAVSIQVPIDLLDRVWLGDVVTINSTILPDGLGARGVRSTRRGRVYGRKPDFGSGTVMLDVLVYAAENVAGYAPAVRIGSVNDETSYNAAVAYLSGTATDYAGSNLAGYRWTANDGGVSWFESGHKVRLRQIDSTSPAEEGPFTINWVNPTTREFTLLEDTSSGAVNWPALIEGGAVVDVVSDDYDIVTADQQRFAFVASRATGTLDGAQAKEWSP